MIIKKNSNEGQTKLELPLILSSTWACLTCLIRSSLAWLVVCSSIVRSSTILSACLHCSCILSLSWISSSSVCSLSISLPETWTHTHTQTQILNLHSCQRLWQVSESASLLNYINPDDRTYKTHDNVLVCSSLYSMTQRQLRLMGVFSCHKPKSWISTSPCSLLTRACCLCTSCSFSSRDSSSSSTLSSLSSRSFCCRLSSAAACAEACRASASWKHTQNYCGRAVFW